MSTKRWRSASSMTISSRLSPRFMMGGSILDSQFAGNIGRVALADIPISRTDPFTLRNTKNWHPNSPLGWRATSSRGSPSSNYPSTSAAACVPPTCPNASIAKSSAALASRVYSPTNLPSSASSPPSSWKPPMSGKPDAPTSPTLPNPKQPTKPHLQIQPLTLLQKKSCAARLIEAYF